MIYTRKLNAALEKHADLRGRSLVDLLSNLDALPEEVGTAVRNNGGGYFNHALFWETMSPSGGGAPEGDLVNRPRRFCVPRRCPADR